MIENPALGMHYTELDRNLLYYVFADEVSARR